MTDKQSDIVAELREAAYVRYGTSANDPHVEIYALGETLEFRAADELERLRAASRELLDDLKAAYSDNVAREKRAALQAALSHSATKETTE